MKAISLYASTVKKKTRGKEVERVMCLYFNALFCFNIGVL